MGVFIWHQWARFVSITASIYTLWSGYWGLFYRKFFWDFLTGTLRAPGGLQPSKSALPFVAIIVKMPILQIIAIVVALLVLCLEMPLPAIKNTSVHRTWIPHIMLLLIQGLVTSLYYQGTNAALWSAIGAFGYIQAQARGEEREEVKQNRGMAGRA